MGENSENSEKKHNYSFHERYHTNFTALGHISHFSNFSHDRIGKTRHKLLGFELRPISLWHINCLHFIKHPIAYDGNDKIANDFFALLQLCIICSARPFSDINDVFEKAEKLIKKKYMTALAEKFILDSDFYYTQLKNYFDSYFLVPKFSTKRNSETTSIKMPWFLHVATTLMMRFGISEKKAWLMLVGKALWYFYSLAEVQGAEIGIINSDIKNVLKQAGYDVSKI